MKQVTNNGKRGGNLVGKPHKNKSGQDVGGIKAVVTDAGNKPVELEGGEVIINKEASKKHWKLLSQINQSAGNGVPIEKPIDPHDEDPSEEYERGGTIDFNANHVPNRWIINYAKKIKNNHPEVWKLGGNIFGNEAFKNLSRVSERGYWLDSEEWMYKKWQSFLARHQHDFRIAGVIAMLKWAGKVNKGWAYMKDLIEAEIKKRKPKPKSMKDGGSVEFKPEKKGTLIKGSEIIKYYEKVNGNYRLVFYSIKESKGKVPILCDAFDYCKKIDTSNVTPNELIELIENNNLMEQERNAKPKSMKDGGNINSTNYFENTKADFKPISVEQGKAILEEYFKWRKKRNKPDYIEVSDFGKLKVNFESVNRNARYKSRGLSFYFVNESNDYIIRISDHWSKSNYNRSQKLNCGDIASCYWTNYGEKFSIRIPSETYSSEMIAGKCDFDDFQKRVYLEYSEGGNVVTYKEKFNKKYGFEPNDSHSLAEIAKLTKLKLSALQDIYDKGIGAYKTNPQSVRPNVKSKEQWAMARVYSAVMGGKAARVDANELERGKKYHLGGDMSKHLAPNGKPSNLTHEQWHLVRTPEFKAWFGNWENDPANASKVIDENGEPLVVYHGGTRDFDKFDSNKIGYTDSGFYGYGFYFSPSSEIAELYGNAKPYFLKITNIYNCNKDNPFYLQPQSVTEYYIDKGYEGSSKTFDVDKKYHEYCVFFAFPNNIKLADGSNTTFDGSNADIMYKNGGLIPANGTLTSKDKKSKLDYKKIGDSYEFVVYDGQHRKRINNKVIMNYNQFVNYLYSEGYIDDRFEDGGEIAFENKLFDELAHHDAPSFKKGGELDFSEQELEQWRTENKVNQRYKQNTKVKDAATKLSEGNITQDEYLKIVKEESPIKAFKEVPQLPTLKEIVGSLKSNQLETGVIGHSTFIKDGSYVASRLDIPAYNTYDVWIVSVHDGTKEGNAIGYGQTAYLKDVTFKTSPKVALRISMGLQDKSTFARMFGTWVNKEPKEVRSMAIKYMNDPSWIQVGMNPYRHSWFYDKSDGMPLVSADEVIQVGALVLAKNAVKTTPKDSMFIADKSNPDIKFNKGGEVETKLNDIILYHEKEGNWFVPKNTIYAWLYDEPNVGKKLESGEYDAVFFPPSGNIMMAMQRGYVPPLLKVWKADFKKRHKGSEHLLGIMQGYIDKDKNKLVVMMMTTNPKHRRKGINQHIIKSIRSEFDIPQENIVFDNPTELGSKFIAAGKYMNGGLTDIE